MPLTHRVTSILGAVTGRQEHLDYWNDLIELAEELEEL